MSFNRNRRIVVTIGTKKGQSYINHRDIIKEIGESIVELDPGEEVVMVRLLDPNTKIISKEEELLRNI